MASLALWPVFKLAVYSKRKIDMFLPIHLTEESINLVIAALRKLPHDQVHDLVMDIATQRDNAISPAPSAPVEKKPRKPRTPKVKAPE